jgi:dTDP-4-dehydrorhamnose 3,5-epimerase
VEEKVNSSWELLPLKPFTDPRGTLKKVLRQSQLKNTGIQEVYLLYTNPGGIRGNHYHKNTLEFFLVVLGTATVALQAPGEKTSKTISLAAEGNLLLKVPPQVAHAFKNEGEGQLIILALSTREYSPLDTDTFPQTLLI